ncbi:MAG: hypothetical protein EXR69_14830 [Myxococcales bacterium]|nr:hypothetical protein [Myxococcales bacterium]
MRTLPLLSIVLFLPGCAATFGVASGIRASHEYEPTPEDTVALEDSTLRAERAELRVAVANVSATGVDLSVEQRAVCPVATLSQETFLSTHPPKTGRLIGALAIDLVATGLAAGLVAYSGTHDVNAPPKEWQRNTAIVGGVGGGAMVLGVAGWVYPSLAGQRHDLRVDYSSDWCSGWTAAQPSRLHALVVDAKKLALLPSMSTAEEPLALTAVDADIKARRAQLAPKWLANEVAPEDELGEGDIAYGGAPWSDRGMDVKVPNGTALPTTLGPTTNQPGIPAAGLGRLVWGRGEVAPTLMTVYLDVGTAGATPGRGMTAVEITPTQFSRYGDAWRCAALDDNGGPAPWAGTSASEMMTVLDRLRPMCREAVAETRAAVCSLGADGAAGSAAGSLNIGVEDLRAYDTCPDSPWRATFQTVLDRNITDHGWTTAYATIGKYAAYWGAEWRDAALAKVVPADVRVKAAEAITARDLLWALSALSEHGSALPAAVIAQLQATVAGRSAAVLATPNGVGEVDRGWLEDAQALAEALPAGPAAAVRKRVDQVEAAIISAAEQDIKALVAERAYTDAEAKVKLVSGEYPSGARISAWAEKKTASLQAQSDAYDAAEAARAAAEERREAARQAAAARREAAECTSTGFYGSKVCDRAGRRYYNGSCYCTDYWLVKKEPGNFSGTCSPCLTQ